MRTFMVVAALVGGVLATGTASADTDLGECPDLPVCVQVEDRRICVNYDESWICWD